MFKIIDRYIIKKLVSSFVLMILLITIIIFVVDYAEKSDAFIKHNLGFKEIYIDYFINFIPFMLNAISPIIVFLTVVWVTARLSTHSEIIAMQSCGISLKRILLPYAFISLVLCIATFFMVAWIVPNLAKKKLAFEHKYIEMPHYYTERNIHFRINDSSYIYMESYNVTTKRGSRFTLEVIKDNNLKEKWTATDINWNEELKKWHIPSYKVYTFGTEMTIEEFKTGFDTAFIITPGDFGNTYKLFESMTVDELKNYIDKQNLLGNSKVNNFRHERYVRYAYPFAIIILTMMGVIISQRKTRQGSGIKMAIGFGLAFFYIFLFMMSKNVVTGFDAPFLIAWVPNLMFIFITFIFYLRETSNK